MREDAHLPVDPARIVVYPLATSYLLNPVGIAVLIIASGEIASISSAALVAGLVLPMGALDALVFANIHLPSKRLNPTSQLISDVELGILQPVAAVQLIVPGLGSLGLVAPAAHWWPDRSRRAALHAEWKASIVTRRPRLAVLAAVLTALAGPAAAAEPPALDEAVGQIEFRQVQMALFYSGSVGGGTLTFDGRAHPFSMGGLGIGGIGVSRIEAKGEVYGLERPEDIEGAYAQVRYGAVAGGDSMGELWLQNASGVEIRLQSTRRGLALSLGGDAVYIRLD